MIHYHGTPIGGTRACTAEFLMGRHALVSFYRPDDMAAVMDCCQTFVLDNGAFSHWKSGAGEIDFDAYAKWVLEYSRHPSFDWCLIPDIIDGTEADNFDWVTRWTRSGFKAKGVPIFHLHESLEYLDYLVTNYEWVALGSSGVYSNPGSGGWWRRMAEVMGVMCDSNGRPRCKIHGLRMLNPAIFSQLPLSSADSTNAAMNGGSISRFGQYVAPTSAQRSAIIAERIESVNSAYVWPGSVDNLAIQNELLL